MDDKSAAWSVSVLKSVRDIRQEDWDRCAHAPDQPYNPFLDYAYWLALEESGSASPRTGWAPCHLVLKDGGGGVAGVMPCYLKSHSYGEYVFDRSWAVAYERAGGRYYPKLQTAVPFTPVSGRRILIRPGVPEDEARALLAAAALQVASKIAPHPGI